MTDATLHRPHLPVAWRTPAVVALSLMAHVVVLGALGWRAIEADAPPTALPSPFYLDIEPRVLRPDEKPRPAAVARATEAAVLAGPTGVRLHVPRLADPTQQTSQDAQAAGTPAAPAAADPWRYQPETLGAGVARSLRTSPIGCDMRAGRMSLAEQQLCDERFGERAAQATPISGSGNPDRDARFAREGAQALAEYEARRRPLAGGTGVVGPQDGPGSNFGMGVAGAHIDPSLRPDSTQNIRTDRRDGPR